MSPPHKDELLEKLRAEFTRSVESWRPWLMAWEEVVWPVFRSYGYDRNTALTAWLLNRVENSLDELSPHPDEDDDEDDDKPWLGKNPG